VAGGGRARAGPRGSLRRREARWPSASPCSSTLRGQYTRGPGPAIRGGTSPGRPLCLGQRGGIPSSFLHYTGAGEGRDRTPSCTVALAAGRGRHRHRRGARADQVLAARSPLGARVHWWRFRTQHRAALLPLAQAGSGPPLGPDDRHRVLAARRRYPPPVSGHCEPPPSIHAALGLGALLLAFGDHFTLYRLAFDLVPGVAFFRIPARILILFNLAVAMLAGVGVHALLGRRDLRGLGRFVRWGTGLAAAAAPAMYLLLLWSAEEALASAAATLVDQYVLLLLVLAGSLGSDRAGARARRRPGLAPTGRSGPGAVAGGRSRHAEVGAPLRIRRARPGPCRAGRPRARNKRISKRLLDGPKSARTCQTRSRAVASGARVERRADCQV